jgi:DNA-binding CsgD family transcriptional regulator
MALEMIRAPAAFITDEGKLAACNESFSAKLGGEILDRKNCLQFSDRNSDDLLQAAIWRMRVNGQGSSIPLPPSETRDRAVLHVVPLCGQARDVFAQGGGIVVIAGLSGPQGLSQELLQGLFDLTPAEARLARTLMEGLAPAEAAGRFQVSEATIRTQMKALFAKTGQSRQTDLIRMLGAFVLPGASVPD